MIKKMAVKQENGASTLYRENKTHLSILSHESNISLPNKSHLPSLQVKLSLHSVPALPPSVYASPHLPTATTLCPFVSFANPSATSFESHISAKIQQKGTISLSRFAAHRIRYHRTTGGSIIDLLQTLSNYLFFDGKRRHTHTFECIHSLCRHCAAVARLSGSMTSIGNRKSANALASDSIQWYLLMRTSCNGQRFSGPPMLHNVPFCANVLP